MCYTNQREVTINEEFIRKLFNKSVKEGNY